MLYGAVALPSESERAFGATGWCRSSMKIHGREFQLASDPLVPLSVLDQVKDQQKLRSQLWRIQVRWNARHKMVLRWCAMLLCNKEQHEWDVPFGMIKPKNWQPPGTSLMLYQVLISKRRDQRSWEIGSWRGTSLVACAAEMATAMRFGFVTLETRRLFPFWESLLNRPALLQAGRNGSQRQLPHFDGDSCEGLGWLPCHCLVLGCSGRCHGAWATAEVGDRLWSRRLAGVGHFVRLRHGCVAHWFLREIQKGSTVRGRASNLLIFSSLLFELLIHSCWK